MPSFNPPSNRQEAPKLSERTPVDGNSFPTLRLVQGKFS